MALQALVDLSQGSLRFGLQGFLTHLFFGRYRRKPVPHKVCQHEVVWFEVWKLWVLGLGFRIRSQGAGISSP